MTPFFQKMILNPIFMNNQPFNWSKKSQRATMELFLPMVRQYAFKFRDVEKLTQWWDWARKRAKASYQEAFNIL